MFRLTQKIKRNLVFLWPLLLPTLLVAGESARVSVFDGITRHLEPTTATFGKSTLNFPGSSLREDSAVYSVEASVAPHFTLFQGAFSGPLGGAYRLNITPKFVVRCSDGVGSNPVRTPSYIPEATLFYNPRDSVDASSYWYLSFGLSHYSNGQTGPFLRSDGRLNNVDGSFSLWSNTAALHLYNEWPLLPTYKAFQVEYFHHKENLLDDLYPDVTLSLKMQTADYVHPAWRGLAGHSRIMMDLNWLVQNTSALPDAMKPAPFSTSVTGVYAPGKLFPALALFGRFYAGFDYYNMNFDNEIYRLDVGVMLDLH